MLRDPFVWNCKVTITTQLFVNKLKYAILGKYRNVTILYAQIPSEMWDFEVDISCCLKIF